MTDYPKEYGAWVRAHRWTHIVHLTLDPKVEQRVKRLLVRTTAVGTERVVTLRMVDRVKRRVGRAGPCPRTVEGIAKAFEQQYVRQCTKLAQQRVPYVFAVELGGSGSNPHIHALLHGTEAIPCAQLAEVWRHGRARVEVYDPFLNGATYLAKEAGLPDFNWDVSKTLPPLWTAENSGTIPPHTGGVY